MEAMKLIKQIDGIGKNNRHHEFSLWFDAEGYDIVDQPTPKTFTITCKIDGDEACCETWNGYDFSTHYDEQEALKEMSWWESQLLKNN